MEPRPSPEASLILLLRALKLPGFIAHWSELAVEAERAGSSFGQYLHQLAEIEMAVRRERRVRDALRQSKLPLEKTPGSLKLDRLPATVQRTLPRLCAGGFVGRGPDDRLLALGVEARRSPPTRRAPRPLHRTPDLPGRRSVVARHPPRLPGGRPHRHPRAGTGREERSHPRGSASSRPRRGDEDVGK